MGWNTSDQLAQQAALEVLLNGPLSRSEIAQRLGIARATMTRISGDLIARGVLLECEPVEKQGQGRPIVPLDVVSDAHYFVGIKLTAERIEAVVTNLKAQIVDSFVITLTSTAVEDVLSAIVNKIKTVAQRTPISAVGIGIGALVTPAGVVTSAAFLSWQDVPLAEQIKARTGISTYVANDLAAFTRAQHWFGTGRGHDSFVTITVGAGVGYGCIANGRLLAGPDYGLGLAGHWPLDPLGPLCSRGHRGCAESMLTIPAIERDATIVLGRSVKWEEVMRLGKRGHPGIARILNTSGRALGRLIAAAANLAAPELVIIGGEGAELAEVAAPAIQAAIQEERDPAAQPVKVITVTGDNAPWCRGAAVIAIQGFVAEAAPSTPSACPVSPR